MTKLARLMVAAAAMLFLVLASAVAQEGEHAYQVLIPTQPSGVSIYQDGRFLGVSGGTPIILKYPPGTESLVLSLSLAGYNPQTLPVSRMEAREGRLPRTVDLHPTSFWVGLRDWPHLRLAMTVLTATLLSMAAAGWWMIKLRRDTRQKQQEIQNLQAQNQGDPLVGSTLGRYRLTRKLGSGGMGDVYLATREDAPEERVAVKILRRAEVAHDATAEQVHEQRKVHEERRQRLGREIDILNNLRHPGITALLDYGQAGSLDYLVMELVQGTSLRDRILGQPLTPQQAWKYLQQVLEAVAAAHDRQIVHRDLKPENLMVTSDGRIKVLDFGLGRDRLAATMTRSNQVMGTPEYMAPEQVMSERADPRMDQYAIGIMAYEMLSGRRPFEGDGDWQLMVARIQAEPTPLSHHCNVPGTLEAVVMRMIARDPAERFPDLRSALQAFKEVMPR